MRLFQATKLQRNHCIFTCFFKIMRRFQSYWFYENNLMPIYEYRCDNCGHELEAIQKVSDPRLTTCPACEQDALRKKISAAGFRLKGGGWYETDFKNAKKRNVAGEEKSGGDSKESGEKSSKDGTGAKGNDGAAAKPAAEKNGKSTSEGKGTSSTSKTKAAE
jgi:putative FmdB family regulatory protein